MIGAKTFTAAAIGFLISTATVGGALAADTVRINGSGSALDLMKPMIEAYKKTNKNVVIVMEHPLGSSGAVKALLGGMLDIVVSSKQLTPEESSKGCQLKKFGKTPLVTVTERGVKKTDVTSRELADIYSGKTTSWPNGEQIRLVLRPKGDIDTKILRDLSPEMDHAVTGAHNRPGMMMAVTDPESYSTIAKTAGAIGATGLTSIVVGKLPLNTLSFNKVKPSLKNLANGTYPLAKDISFVVTAKTPPAALKFIDFAYSNQGRAVAEKAGVLVTTAAHE